MSLASEAAPQGFERLITIGEASLRQRLNFNVERLLFGKPARMIVRLLRVAMQSFAYDPKQTPAA
jgi:hypothetical protein